MMTRENNKQHNIKHVLVSELHSCKAYWERLQQVSLTMSEPTLKPKVKEILREFLIESTHLYQTKLFQEDFSELIVPQGDIRETLDGIRENFSLWESVIKLPMSLDQVGPRIVEFINMSYEFCHDIHFLLNNSYGEYQVQYPRLNAITMTIGGQEFDSSWLDEASNEQIELFDREDLIPSFALCWNRLNDIETSEKFETARKFTAIHSLEWQRDKKYVQLIEEGHKLLVNGRKEKALGSFMKAKELKESAEVYTMIAWAHYQMGRTDKAKSNCFLAIKTDPDYGPPYNDLGTYLLKEGAYRESLKWFKLAKKAAKYENREFPYINCGRVYLMMKDFDKAIAEFKTALTLAPHNRSLRETIEKLGKDLENQEEVPLTRSQDPEPWNLV